MFADCPTPLADERPIPLSVLPLERRMIVPPIKSHEENEGNKSKDRIEFYGQR